MRTPGQLELLVSMGFQMNLKFAPLTLRMLVTMCWNAGTKSLIQLSGPDPCWLQTAHPIWLAFISQPSRIYAVPKPAETRFLARVLKWLSAPPLATKLYSDTFVWHCVDGPPHGTMGTPQIIVNGLPFQFES